MSKLPILFIGLYLIILIIIVYFSIKKESSSDYIIGSRKIGMIGTVASLAAGFRDGAGIVVWITIAAIFGFGALWFSVGMSLALLLLALHAPKICSLAKERNFVTTGDLFSHFFGRKTALISSLIIVIGSLLIATAQLFVSGTIFSRIFNISPAISISLISAVIGIYLLVGGYKTVIKTDILQWGVIMIVVLIPFFIPKTSFFNIPLSSFFSPSIQSIIGFVGLSFLVIYSRPDVWQRIFSAKSPTVARKSFLWVIPIFLLISLGLVIFSFGITGIIGPVEANEAFFALFSATSSILISIVGLFVAVSVMSTIDTEIFLGATTFVKDLLPQKFQSSSKRFVATSRIFIVLSFLILAFLAIKVSNLLEFVFGAYTSVTILLPLFIFSTLSKRRKSPQKDIWFAIVLIISLAVYTWMFIGGYFENILLTLVPGILSLILCSIVFFFSKK